MKTEKRLIIENDGSDYSYIRAENNNGSWIKLDFGKNSQWMKPGENIVDIKHNHWDGNVSITVDQKTIEIPVCDAYMLYLTLDQWLNSNGYKVYGELK